MRKTLYDKLWESHVVHMEEDGAALLCIDRHLVHEVTSPHGFRGPEARRPEAVTRVFDRRHRRLQHADRLEPGERCASIANRNFEGSQGNGGRTHMLIPAMAGHFVDVRHWH